MGKKCCCRCGGACCGCCCGKRGATITFSIIGLLLAVAVIVPPVYVYMTDRQFDKLFPVIGISKRLLIQATEAKFGPEDNSTTKIDELSHRQQNYKLAIFQLLDDIQEKASCLALSSFCVGCLNIPIHLMLFGGSVFRVPCLMLPWLALTLIEHLILGVPFIVFFGIISLYLAAQLELYVAAGVLMGGIVFLFLLSLSSWFTVHACYNEFYQRQDYLYYEGGVMTGGGEATQPLLPSNAGGGGGGSGGGQRGNNPPALPPGHPAANSYNFGQYPHYNAGNGSRQLPSAPPGANSSGSMYPQLPA